jgi:hypothetical protein
MSMETATSVLEHAENEPPDYVSPRTQRDRERNLLPGVIALIVIGALVVLLSRSGTGSTTTTPAGSPQAAPSQSQPTPSEVAAADAKLKEQMANGWVPFGGASGVNGATVPSSAWVKWDPHPDPRSLPADGRVAVYDAPNGNIVGYNFPALGYVPKATVDSGRFDPAQARIAKFGCDPKADDACRERLSRQVANGG